tara:strand:+ start:2632 stop:2850 length:219 start_codon:yes stop_codon:yes gene_type:complete
LGNDPIDWGSFDFISGDEGSAMVTWISETKFRKRIILQIKPEKNNFQINFVNHILQNRLKRGMTNEKRHLAL